MRVHPKHIFRLTAAAVLGPAAAMTFAASPAAADVSPVASSSDNWAGYVAGNNNFSSVSGSWVQPAVQCTSGGTYSVFWVGIGGSSGQSGALEQAGTQADCTNDGQTDYHAWYELVPAAPVTLDLAVKPGDHITTKVSVSGSNVTINMSNQTTGATVSKTVQASQIDTSSAEWIAEAPSQCDQGGNCQPLPLADFNTVNFTGATATAGGHTGTISDSDWSAQPVQLSGGGGGYGYDPTAVDYGQSGSAGAQPTTLSSDGSSFSVSYGNSSSSASGTGTVDPYGDGGYGYPDPGYGYGYGDPSYGYGYGGYSDGGYSLIYG
jgi:hypothetical protein